MNPVPAGADGLPSPYRSTAKADVIVFPTFLDLKACVSAKLVTGAQCGHPDAKGAHTGEIAMATLKALGCAYVLCGHSERRRDCGDTDERVAAQVIGALKAGLHPILCVGETEEERDGGEANEAVERQLETVLSRLPHSSAPGGPDFTIAYEPVWAIGSGKNATPEDAQRMHEFIRALLPAAHRERVRILYGGSLTAENAGGILAEPDIDGSLIGGASLRPADFARIVEIAGTLKS